MAPPAASQIFGDRFGLAERYVAHLADTGVSHGLLGPREAPRLWSRHVLNCAVVTELIGQDQLVADVGSGAGLPGLAMAIRRPDLQVVLIEPLLRRVTWLQRVVDDLELSNVVIERGRAEQLWDAIGPVDVVTSRAVSALDNLATWSAPLLRPGGVMLPMRGSSAAADVEQSEKVLAAVGVTGADVVECGAQWLDEPTTVVRLTVGRPQRLSKSGAASKKSKRSRRARL
ncbi:16S rRNA (guanine(527)-N(7))-methyltransferase RsmG [Rudaeicoccus suwonensis]|uniref:16S rRNA (guanine(527)-N(7))-methyltransferase RsmG n=1 Tax=Rudaeicoccus suwonensis TaxID=657409 RepID=UPI001BA7AE1D|nr:16S rRNA (guanine(527)-N(7))-methyltransferase RsmG [Rudaeicoccus suwonensis]